MRRALADTVSWLARIHPSGQWHAASKAFGGLRLVTTDEVLDEVLAHFGAFGPALRSQSARIVRQVLAHPDVEVVHRTRQSFLAGLAHYEVRLDKAYSLTDCIAMETRRREGLTKVPTRDLHFTKEGFVNLP